MPRTGHYLFGLLMFCLASVFTLGLASFLQQAAIASQQAAVAAPVEVSVVSATPAAPSYFRKASF
jgi:hypothetical protein